MFNNETIRKWWSILRSAFYTFAFTFITWWYISLSNHFQWRILLNRKTYTTNSRWAITFKQSTWPLATYLSIIRKECWNRIFNRSWFIIVILIWDRNSCQSSSAWWLSLRNCNRQVKIGICSSVVKTLIINCFAISFGNCIFSDKIIWSCFRYLNILGCLDGAGIWAVCGGSDNTYEVWERIWLII